MPRRIRITPKTILFTEPVTVTGYLVEKSSYLISGRERGKYYLRADSGEMIILLGSTLLDRDMDTIPEGAYLEVNYLGEEKTLAGQKVKLFEVYQLEPTVEEEIDGIPDVEEE